MYDGQNCGLQSPTRYDPLFELQKDSAFKGAFYLLLAENGLAVFMLLSAVFSATASRKLGTLKPNPYGDTLDAPYALLSALFHLS